MPVRESYQKGRYLLLRFVVFQYVLDFAREPVETKALPQQLDRAFSEEVRTPTFNAVMICSGAIVFFDSSSQTSFASEAIKWMNSANEGVRLRAVDSRVKIVFTYTTFDD